MDPSLYTQWSQTLSESSQQNEGRASTVEIDWSKDRQNSTTPSNSSTTTPLNSNSMEMSDFSSLADLGSPPSTSALASTSTFFTSYPHSNYFLSTYPTVAYGSGWSSQSPVPLSNYSSLNGATTSTTSSAPSPLQSPQQSSNQPGSSKDQQSTQLSQTPSPPLPLPSNAQPMVIDPALTTLNSTRTVNGQQYPAVFNNIPSQSQSQPVTQYPYAYLSALYRHTPPYYQSQTSQGTLSPQALHTSTSSMLSSINPTSFYSTLAPTSAMSGVSKISTVSSDSVSDQELSPEERRRRFLASIKPLLTSNQFTGAGAVNSLVSKIKDHGSQDVDAATRLDILTKIRDGAGNHYFRAWSESFPAIEITRDWLKAAFNAESDSILIETLMPLLHIVDRLPLTLDSLKASKLGKIVVKLVKEPFAPAVRDMASNIERKWRSLVSTAEGMSKASESNTNDDSKMKKRKLVDALASNKNTPPTKKLASGNALSKPMVVKKELMKTVPPSMPTVKDAKSDSSFFSAPKPKPKLPSFKKAPPTPTVSIPKPSADNVARPSSIDAFQEALKSMAKNRKDSPADLTPPGATTPPVHQQLEPIQNGRKKKSVTWASADKLESIRLIEKAIYDDDPVDGVHLSHNLRDLDRGEGAALHAHIFEETVDWSEPLLIQIPEELEYRPKGEQSEEKLRQEEREQTALGALYVLHAHIPETPLEATHVITEEETDRRAQIMTCGTDADEVFWNTDPVVSNSQSVADLVGQLAAGVQMVDPNPMAGMSSTAAHNLNRSSFGLDSNAAVAAIQALPQEHIQHLLQQLTNPTIYTQTGDERHMSSLSGQGDQLGRSGYTTDYSIHTQYPEEMDRGWKGRGRGRGRGRGGEFRHNKSNRETRLCNFFLAGRCKYGDQCDFLHVTNPS